MTSGPERDQHASDGEGDEGARSAHEGTPVPVQLEPDLRARLTWALMVGGPVVWFSHFMLVYLVAEAGCTGSGPGLRLFDPPVPVILTLVATGIAAVACAAIAVAAWRRWRVSEREEQRASAGREEYGDDFDEEQRRSALAFIGFLLATLSVLAVLFTGAPALVLGPC